jgi:2-isopropylmalate synthase
MQTAVARKAQASTTPHVEFVCIKNFGKTETGPFTVRVQLMVNGRMDSSQGISSTGILDAAANAIKNLVPHGKTTQTGYEVVSTGVGSQAIAKASVTLQCFGRLYAGEAQDTDTVTSSVKAYVDALNNLKSQIAI